MSPVNKYPSKFCDQNVVFFIAGQTLEITLTDEDDETGSIETCPVHVKVVGDNRGGHRSSSLLPTLSGTIHENQKPGAVVHFPDQDLNLALSELRGQYLVLSDRSAPFSLSNEPPYQIITTKKLDREARKKHSLLILAEKSKGLRPVANLTVEVLDVNDNLPRFVEDLDEDLVWTLTPQTSRKYSIVGKVLAVDDDGDDVVYQFADDFPKVNISFILPTAPDFFVK